MTSEREDSALKFYIAEFQRLAAKGENGEDVSELIAILAENAIKHLDPWKSGGQTYNRPKLIAQLKMRANYVAHSSPRAAKVLEEAAKILAK
ncbi:hypothetical protein [Caballeronia sp. GAWG2-1]|uniref:hypothetical protein n=1 Tax=Caballeronia sp. GAWG2-1 TaxID=2921744 RepID=UPI002028085F|nr:hypothetical protein [Caballeronia sp. GAWG2-1]